MRGIDLKKVFPQRLKTAMGKMRVAEFSRISGVTDSLLRKYLEGGALPGMLVLQKICIASGRPAGYFFGEDEASSYKAKSRKSGHQKA